MKNKRTGFITESYYEDGKKKQHVKLFDYLGDKYMATWDGKLIPHECAKCFINRIFRDYD